MHVGVSAASQPNASNGTSAQLLSLVMSGQHGCAASLLCGADRLRSHPVPQEQATHTAAQPGVPYEPHVSHELGISCKIR